MSVASIETTLELWASSLRDLKARIKPLVKQKPVLASAGLFLDGLLATSDARPAGCAPRRRATPACGATGHSRPRPVERGCGMRCAMSCGTMSSST